MAQKKRSASRSRKSGRKSVKMPPLNLSLVVAVALVVSVYVIVTLFNGRGTDLWKESWQDLVARLTSFSVSDLPTGGSAPDGNTVPAPSGEVRVHFIDVGQGDSILVEGNGEAFLIDAGENNQGDTVAGYLTAAGVDELQLAIGTHPHSDHIGGLDVVLEEIPTSTLWMPGLPDSMIPTTKTYNDLLDAMEATGTEGVLAGPGDTLEICGGLLQVLGPLTDYDDLNDMSLVTRFTYGDTSFLFTGDMEQGPEGDLLEAGVDVSADLLKMGHHGSSTSSSRAFVEAVDPEVFVITVGEGNSYGHPHKETLSLLDSLDAEVWRTDLNGSIVVTTDGSEMQISSER